MERISIPVKKVTSGFSPKAFLATTTATLLVGLFAGIFVQANIIRPLPMNVRSILGAVGAAALGQDAQKTTTISTPEIATFTSAPSTGESVPAQTPASGTEGGTVQTNSPSRAEERATLEATIQEKTLAIEQNTQEIERIKNASVTLIAEFNQNCGNWDDTCASQYRDALEKNNTTYEGLLVAQRALYKELADTQRLLVAAE